MNSNKRRRSKKFETRRDALGYQASRTLDSSGLYFLKVRRTFFPTTIGGDV